MGGAPACAFRATELPRVLGADASQSLPASLHRLLASVYGP